LRFLGYSQSNDAIATAGSFLDGFFQHEQLQNFMHAFPTCILALVSIDMDELERVFMTASLLKRILILGLAPAAKLHIGRFRVCLQTVNATFQP